MHIRLSEAWWVLENEFHSNPEPGFYGSDEYMELFHDNWVLDEMMLLTFMYPIVPANKAHQPQGPAIAEVFGQADSDDVVLIS